MTERRTTNSLSFHSTTEKGYSLDETYEHDETIPLAS